MERFLQMTAWVIRTPAPYGSFHILTAVLGIAAAVFAARRCAGRVRSSKARRCACDSKKRLVIGVGFVLLISEIYKQLFCFYIIDGQHYNWYRFPFQLCSLPMYFSLIVPHFRSERLKTTIYTFMTSFNLMGAVMAFADPSGFFSKYAVLTAHGILWHVLVIFISFFIGLTDMADTSSPKSFLKTLPLFFVCCGIAAAINTGLHSYGGANMFYIDPYAPSVQLVFKDIAAAFGIAAGNIAYIFAMILGGFICHLLFWEFHGRKR